MAIKKFSIYKTKNVQWDGFVNRSLQNNIFCKSWFLNCYNREYQSYLVKYKKKTYLGVVVAKKPFVYQGLLYASNFNNLPLHKKANLEIELLNYLLNYLASKYKKISLSLHYSLKDIRVFQWFNYQKSKKHQFKIDLRYTGVIELENFKNFACYLRSIRKARRYEYKQALKNNLQVLESDDIEKLSYLHKLTFKRQGIKRTNALEKKLLTIASNALKEKCGNLYLCQDSKGRDISATLFLFDKKCGYYLFAANQPNLRQLFGGTFLFLKNIKHCFNKKLQFVDVCGINSPNRGDYKTSFNARVKPYYELFWKRL